MTQMATVPKYGGVGGDHDPRRIRHLALRRLLRVIEREEPIISDTGDVERGFYATQVAAASRLLSHSEWAEERNDATKESQFFKLFPSDQAAAKWLLENRDQLLKIAGMSSENLLASDAAATATQTENSHDDEAK